MGLENKPKNIKRKALLTVTPEKGDADIGP